MMQDYRNEISLDEIFEKIDEAIENRQSIMFVCNWDLAYDISDYLFDEFDIEDENTQLSVDDLDEYYVSLYFHGNKIEFYCESARGTCGNFKVNDCGTMDYYVFLEMSDEEVIDCLQPENGTLGFYDLIEDDDEDFEDADDDMVDCDMDCEHCGERIDEDDIEDDEDIPDSAKEELEMLMGWANVIDENDLCFGCIFNTVAEAYYSGRDIGYRNAKLETIEQANQEIEDMDRD